jgi:hypothetical protein
MKKILLIFVMLLIFLITLCGCNKYHYGSFYSRPTKRKINRAMRNVGWEYKKITKEK